MIQFRSILLLFTYLAPAHAAQDLIHFERDLQLFGDALYNDILKTVDAFSSQLLDLYQTQKIAGISDMVKIVLNKVAPSNASLLHLFTSEQQAILKPKLLTFFHSYVPGAMHAALVDLFPSYAFQIGPKQPATQKIYGPTYLSNIKDSAFSMWQHIYQYDAEEGFVKMHLTSFLEKLEERYSETFEANQPLHTNQPLNESDLYDFYTFFKKQVQHDDELKFIDAKAFIDWNNINRIRHQVWQKVAQRISKNGQVIPSLPRDAISEDLRALDILIDVKGWTQQKKFDIGALPSAINALLLSLLQKLSQNPTSEPNIFLANFSKLTKEYLIHWDASLQSNPALEKALTEYIVKSLSALSPTDPNLSQFMEQDNSFKQFIDDPPKPFNPVKTGNAYEEGMRLLQAKISQQKSS